MRSASQKWTALHYLLRGSIERGAELYIPCQEDYAMLEGVEGAAGVTCIRPHRLKQLRVCKRIIGYDANALYLSAILKEMPYWRKGSCTIDILLRLCLPNAWKPELGLNLGNWKSKFFNLCGYSFKKWHRSSWGYRYPRIWGNKAAVACMVQVERAYFRAVQTRM